jgi:simple sugar transport system ATP-binding protein
MRGVTKRFPGVLANDRVDFEAAQGEVHALLGENGAGKSTLSNILIGLYRPDEGELRLDGRTLELHSPRDALDAGIGMVHQHFRLVQTFTVAENVVLGDHRSVGRGLRFRRGAVERAVAELGRRYGLQVDPAARIWQLSVGEQQRVEILKALYREARVLILDEPTAVLTPQEADALFATMRAMAAEGRTVVFISHKLHEVIAVADRVTVLRGGRSVKTLPIAGATPRSLAELMVGRDVDATQRVARTVPHGAEIVLQLDGVWADGDRGAPAISDVDLRLRRGEIVGVAGVAGNGQRELTETIAGMRRATAGRIVVGETALRGGDPREAIKAGIAHVPEDRLHTGLAAGLPISANVVLTSYRGSGVARGPFLRLGAIRDRAVELIRRYDVKAPGPATPVRQLSGGNLQKIVLGREFSSDPRVLIVAAPTRGLDVGAIETVHRHLREAAARGVAVLLVSEDLDEILALADRVAVMYEGRVVGTVEAEGADVAEIGLLMAGGTRE